MLSQCYPNVLSDGQMLESSIACMMIVNHVTILMHCTCTVYIGTRSRPLSLLNVGLNSLKGSL